MNHIPDAVLEAVDELGAGVLLGDVAPIYGTLRTDLWIEIVPETDSTAVCRYKTVHTQSPPTIRDRGSFIETIIDGLDTRLREWGIEPPAAYTYAGTVDDTHYYEGTVQLP